MQRSIVVMLGLGGAACAALSLLMQHLVAEQRARSPSPYTAILESRLGTRLAGPVVVRAARDEAGLRIAVAATVLAGLDRERLALAAGQEVWLAAQRAGERPDEVVVELGEQDGGAPVLVRVPAPRGAR